MNTHQQARFSGNEQKRDYRRFCSPACKYPAIFSCTRLLQIYSSSSESILPLPSLGLRSFNDKERPRMLLDGRLAFYQILYTQLSNIWNHGIRLLERVLGISDVRSIQETRADSPQLTSRQNTSRAPRLS
jgi:hypothetical protein